MDRCYHRYRNLPFFVMFISHPRIPCVAGGIVVIKIKINQLYVRTLLANPRADDRYKLLPAMRRTLYRVGMYECHAQKCRESKNLYYYNGKFQYEH